MSQSIITSRRRNGGDAPAIPSDESAEKAAIASLVSFGNDAPSEFIDAIGPSHFFDPGLAAFWSIFTAEIRDGRPVADHKSLMAAFQAYADRHDEISVAELIRILDAAITDSIGWAYWRYDVERLANAYARRQAFLMADEVLRSIHAGAPAKEALAPHLDSLNALAKASNRKARFQSAGELLSDWRQGLLDRIPPLLFPIAECGELTRIEVGPGLVTLIGAAPNAGKTALTMQIVLDALRLSPALRAVVCSVEMRPETLLERQLARLSGIDLTTIRHRRFEPEHADRIDVGLATLATIADRLSFVRPPFDLENIAASVEGFDAKLLLLDYVQRIRPPGIHGDRRGAVDAVMDHLRQIADGGVAIIVVSSMGRTKDRGGRSSYNGEGLNLASFKESGELEYGADDAFIMVSEAEDGAAVRLKHEKARHGERRDILLRFDGRHQSFSDRVGYDGEVLE